MNLHARFTAPPQPRRSLHPRWRKLFRFLKDNLKTLLASFVLVLFAWELWPYPGGRRIDIILAGTLILNSSLIRVRKNRHSRHELDQFRIFLEYLSARLSAGETLEQSLLKADDVLEDQIGKHSHFSHCLERLRASLEAQIGLQQSLMIFQKEFSHPKSRAFVRVIPFLHRYGGRLDVYVRQSHRSLNEELLTQKEIQAEQSAKNSEAFILLFLPFIMASLIGRGSYGASLQTLSVAKFALAVLFLIAILAASFTLRLIAQQDPYRQKALETPPLADAEISLRDRQRAARFLSLLPGGLGLKLAEAVRFVYAQRPRDPWPQYVKRKRKLFLLGLALLPLLLLAKAPPYLYVLPLLIPLAQDLRIIEAKKLREERYRLEYPDFLNLMAILLKSGLSLDKSLSLQAENLPPDDDLKSILELDLRMIQRRMQSAIPAATALEDLLKRLPSREIVSALSLIIRYDRDGGRELLDILEIQASACWQVYRNAMRAKLERKNLALVIPMGLDLLVILSTTILPALASFMNI